jgi:hypothetical protein
MLLWNPKEWIPGKETKGAFSMLPLEMRSIIVQPQNLQELLWYQALEPILWELDFQ